MRLDYGREIVETEGQLGDLERKLRGKPAGEWVRPLRLLRSGEVRSIRAAQPVLGYGCRTLQRWWERYKREGLEGLVTQRPHLGRASKLTEEAWEGLSVEWRRGG